MTPPKDYHRSGLKLITRFMNKRGAVLLADEMGLGKSYQCLYYLFQNPDIRPVIIICPASLKENWKYECQHHFGLNAEVLSGRKPPRQRLINAHRPILIINYEILYWWVDYLVQLKPQCILADECHYIQNKSTQRFDAVSRLSVGSKAPYRFALSGTPLTNRPFELWGSLNFLLPKKFPSSVEFGFDHCRPKLVRGKWEFKGAKNVARLRRKLTRLCMVRRLKKDVEKDLPPKTRRVVMVDIHNRKEYQEAALDFLGWLKKKSPSKWFRARKNKHLTQIGYLLRLCAKLKRFAIKEWIQNFQVNSDEKLVIFSCHTKMIHYIMDLLGDSAVKINGEVQSKERHSAVQRFKNDSKCRFAVCHPKAAGVGLTMTAASNVLFTDYPFAPGVLAQAEDRIHRIGQTKKCFIWMLVAKDTIEEPLCEMLSEKQDIFRQVLDGEKQSNDYDFLKELMKRSKKRGLVR